MAPVEDSPSGPVQQFGSLAVRGTLGRSSDVDACMALARQVNELLAQAAQHLEAGATGLACRPGCNFCCHLQVKVLPHEAIALFRYLQSRVPPQTAERVRSKIEEYARARGPAATPAPPPRRPCAFLVDGECAAYEVRPGACAAYHSLSKERCEQSFADPTVPSATVALQSLRMVAVSLEEGIKGELAAQGLSTVPAELHRAVAALLANPSLIASWRAGRPMLKSI
jgi:hypothetical protein